jgi:hypothetical protein
MGVSLLEGIHQGTMLPRWRSDRKKNHDRHRVAQIFHLFRPSESTATINITLDSWL